MALARLLVANEVRQLLGSPHRRLAVLAGRARLVLLLLLSLPDHGLHHAWAAVDLALAAGHLLVDDGALAAVPQQRQLQGRVRGVARLVRPIAVFSSVSTYGSSSSGTVCWGAPVSTTQYAMAQAQFADVHPEPAPGPVQGQWP